MLQETLTKRKANGEAGFSEEELVAINDCLSKGWKVQKIREEVLDGIAERTFYFRLDKSGKEILTLRGLVDKATTQ